MNGNRDRDDVPPAEEPAATPLFSAAELDVEDYPLCHIPEEQFYAITAQARELADHSNGDVKSWITGLLGENGYARSVGRVDSLSHEVMTDGGDGGTDLSYRGATVDVKTVGRHRADPCLTVDAYEPLRADYYALASRISKTDIRLIGYAPRQFVANAPTRYHEGEPYHFVDQEYLFPFPSQLL
jgi:hypothetical protein